MATVSTEKPTEKPRLTIVAMMLVLSSQRAKVKYFPQLFNLKPREVEEYINLIIDRGLGHMDGEYLKAKSKGINFVRDYVIISHMLQEYQ